jgi:hypothetical protein
VSVSGLLTGLNMNDELDAIVASRYQVDDHDTRIGVHLILSKLSNDDIEGATAVVDMIKTLPEERYKPLLEEIAMASRHMAEEANNVG